MHTSGIYLYIHIIVWVFMRWRVYATAVLRLLVAVLVCSSC